MGRDQGRVDEEGELRWHALEMAKRSSESSRPVRRVSMKAESISNKALTKRQQHVLDRLAARPEPEIHYSDMPPLSEEQLASAFRPKSKQLILRAAMTARRSA